MKLISFLMKHSRNSLILAIFAGIISGASNAALLAVFNASLKGNATIAALWIFVGLCLFLPAARFVSEVLLTRLSQGALFKLRMQLSRQILDVPLRSLEEIGADRLMTSLTDDVPTVTGTLTVIPLLCINAAVAIGSLIYLGWLSWQLLLGVLGFMAVGIVSYQLPILRAVRYLNRAREDADALFNHFRALTHGTKELKLHQRRREVFLSSVLQSTAKSMERQNVRGLTIYTAASSWGQILVFVAVGLVLFVLPRLHGLDSGTLIGYTITLLYLMTPLQMIMNVAPSLSRGEVALRKIEDLGLSLEGLAAEGERVRTLEGVSEWDLLEMNGVHHTYYREGEKETFALGPIDFTLRKGELVFVIGGNGSGKTTLAKLLVGLYIPESGEIRLDGKPITDSSRPQYREYFSTVFSDFYLFDSLLGLESPLLDETARKYLVQLQLNHKVEVKDGVLSTTALSQGQRKRLALLTAYLEDRDIYVFDEWAADQDPQFKEVFYYHMLPNLKARNKAVVVISHDDRYYGLADRILKLEYGKAIHFQPAAAAAPPSERIAEEISA